MQGDLIFPAAGAPVVTVLRSKMIVSDGKFPGEKEVDTFVKLPAHRFTGRKEEEVFSKKPAHGILCSMSNLVFSINVVAPVFAIILLGVFLKKIKIIDDGFVSRSSVLVYRISLPALIFINISRTDFASIFNGTVILLLYAGIAFAFLTAWLFSLFFIHDKKRAGAFIQGTFWGNSVIVGLALVLNVFGDSGVAAASIIVAFLIPVFNTLAVLVLTALSDHSSITTEAFKRIFFRLSRNPLIIAVAVSLPFSIFRIPLPVLVSTPLSYLARMALPLALLGIGGSLSFSSLKANLPLAIAASGVKIVAVPVFVMIIALQTGITGQLLGILFLLSATPTAISSFIMASAMDSDSELAANIIVVTTLGSIFTMGAGIYFLKTFGLLGR